MKRYELGIEILENGVAVDHQTVYTHAENLDRAQRNIAWRTVVKDNPEAEYPGLAVRFEDGRVIDGGKKTKAIPLYIVLMHDLHKKEIYVDEKCAKQLRQEYAVNKNNYDKKVAQIVDKFKAEETAKTESADAQKEEEVKMEKEIKTAVNENAVPDMLEAIAAVEEYPENIVTIDEQEKLFWKNNKALMKVIADKPFSEKYLYSKVFTILQYNHVDVVLIEGQENRFLHLDFNGSDIELPNNSAIDFGRQVWSEISEIGLDSSRVKNVRDQLITLFTNNKGKQETTPVSNNVNVENEIKEEAMKVTEEEKALVSEGAPVATRWKCNNALLSVEVAKGENFIGITRTVNLWQDQNDPNLYRGKIYSKQGAALILWDRNKYPLPTIKSVGSKLYESYNYKLGSKEAVNFTDKNEVRAWNINQMILAISKIFADAGIRTNYVGGRTANVTACYKKAVNTTPAKPAQAEVAAGKKPVQTNPWASYIK